MVILLAVVIGFVVLRDLNRTAPESPVTAVDYEPSVAFARDRAGFDVLAPQALPEGWQATSVEFTPDPPHWHLGVLTDENKYVGLEQAMSSEQSMVTTYVDRDPTRGKDISIDGNAWTRWSDSGGDTALVRTREGATTLVVGTVEPDVLVDYVKNLR